MKLYDLEQNAQKGLSDSGLKIDESKLDTYDLSSVFKKSRDFSGIKI
jgi:hypothetical protein